MKSEQTPLLKNFFHYFPCVCIKRLRVLRIFAANHVHYPVLAFFVLSLQCFGFSAQGLCSFLNQDLSKITQQPPTIMFQIPPLCMKMKLMLTVLHYLRRIKHNLMEANILYKGRRQWQPRRPYHPPLYNIMFRKIIFQSYPPCHAQKIVTNPN